MESYVSFISVTSRVGRIFNGFRESDPPVIWQSDLRVGHNTNRRRELRDCLRVAIAERNIT